MLAHTVDTYHDLLSHEQRRLETWIFNIGDETAHGVLQAYRMQRESHPDEPDHDELMVVGSLIRSDGVQLLRVWVSDQDLPIPIPDGASVEDSIPSTVVDMLEQTTGLDWSAARAA